MSFSKSMNREANLLIVDADLPVGKTLSQILAKDGHRTLDILTTAADAIERAGRLHPDLILMDIKLRGPQDGIEAAAEIQRRYSIPVLFLSGHSDQATLDKARAVEPYGYLLKPVSEKELGIAVDIAVRRLQAERYREARRVQEACLIELHTIALATSDVEAMKETAVSYLSYLLRAPFTALFEIQRTSLKLLAGKGWEPALMGSSIPMKELAQRLKDHPPFIGAQTIECVDELSPLLLPHAIKDSLCALVRTEEFYGILSAHSTNEASFSPGDTYFIRCVGNILSHVLHRHASEVAMREHAELARTLLEEAPCGYHSVDANGVFLAMNQTELNWLGYTREEVIGKMSLRDIVAPSDQSSLEQNFLAGQRRRTLRDLEGHLRRKNGTIFPVLVNAYWKEDSSGNLVSRTSVLDMSDRKKMEEAKRAEENVLQFARIASHDLREPLRGMQLHAQLLQRKYSDILGKEGRISLGFIQDGANRLSRLIRSLASYSLGGEITSSTRDVEASVAVEEALGALRTLIEKTGAVVQSEKLPAVTCDREQLVIVFQNLISNAIKYCKGSPRVEITASSERQHCTFAVKDNGIGFPPERAKDIFVLFRRLSSLDGVEGTGIGLAICKKIVEAHGGNIWAESVPGEGSVFRFTLPAATATQEAREPEAVEPWRKPASGAPNLTMSLAKG